MLTILEKRDFDRMFSILENSFPKDEYRTYEEHKALLDRSDYRVYAYRQETEVVAFFGVWDVGAYAFVEHFAVAESCRNRGLGSRLLQELLTMLGKPVCLEAELPLTELACRRLAFYRRNGFFENTYPYTQPPLAPGQQPVPLRLLTTGSALSETDFQSLKAALWATVYVGKG